MKPILMSGAMVRAILDGCKTQTRRVVKQTKNFDASWRPVVAGDYAGWPAYQMTTVSGNQQSAAFYCPYGNPGDLLWVRETWQHKSHFMLGEPGFVYRATEPNWQKVSGANWRPSIFMPRAACRIFLQIKAVRIERLQEISGVDALSEGVSIPEAAKGKLYNGRPAAYFAFRVLWAKINGMESWEANPWVWVLEFERVEKSKMNESNNNHETARAIF